MDKYAKGLCETSVDRLFGALVVRCAVGWLFWLAPEIDDRPDAGLLRQQSDLRVTQLPVAASDDLVCLKLDKRSQLY